MFVGHDVQETDERFLVHVSSAGSGAHPIGAVFRIVWTSTLISRLHHDSSVLTSSVVGGYVILVKFVGPGIALNVGGVILISVRNIVRCPLTESAQRFLLLYDTIWQ